MQIQRREASRAGTDNVGRHKQTQRQILRIQGGKQGQAQRMQGGRQMQIQTMQGGRQSRY
jgi:hypothetical protein